MALLIFIRMKLRCTFGLVVWAIFLLGAIERAVAEDRPLRVVSQTVGSDELLLALAQPSQIAALSHLARESAYSAVSEEAQRFAQLRATDDAEAILSFRPTLVLFADYSRAELVEQVRRAGIPVIVFNRYLSLDDVYGNLRLLARELGCVEKCEKLIANCAARVADLEIRLGGVKLSKVLAPSVYGLIPGDRTTFQDMCDHAGADNLGKTLGHLVGHAAPPTEQMLTWPVDFVVVVGVDHEKALAPFRGIPPYKYMDSVRSGRAVLIKPYLLSCVSHFRIEGYELLARALHPEVFR